MRTDLFDFVLPDSAIALHPAAPRDSARLLVVKPVAGSCARDDADVADHRVCDLADILQPGDALVFNNTRVIPAALNGVRWRGEVSANVAFNLTKRVDPSRWSAFARPAKRLEPGDVVRFASRDGADPLAATVSAKHDGGEVELTFEVAGSALDVAIANAGVMPLPPYIALKRAPDATDWDNYQTIYAERDGAVAAPTAGLHFTPELFERLDQRGIARHFVTLHVGAGTFLPVKVEDTSAHRMHSEWGQITADVAAALNATRDRGGRIVAVGTTSLRVLESAARDTGRIAAWSGETDIFITPGYAFKAVDLMVTNFHLPKSTLFMLVAAFSGLGTMRAAYGHALASGYRFYSYGDASLLYPAR